ncbi:MAG: hypothetical protein ACLFRG_01645 [Desulfococcaceae bacterium]
MKPVRFEDLPEDALFWMSREAAPREPYHFKGPYKKKVYVEMRPEHPETVFVKEDRPESG